MTKRLKEYQIGLRQCLMNIWRNVDKVIGLCDENRTYSVEITISLKPDSEIPDVRYEFNMYGTAEKEITAEELDKLTVNNPEVGDLA